MSRTFIVCVIALALASNSWAVTVGGRVVYSFNGTSGATPTGALAFDAHGNVYGTTALGGIGSGCETAGCGTVYELSPLGNSFTETTLYTFENGADGGGPQGGVILDRAGNLYGTTLYAGGGNGCGTVFQLVNSNGVWSKNVLHAFNSSSGDGCFPYSGLTFDSTGNLYGTTASGGTYDTGAVFQLTPNQDGSWNYSVIYNFQAGGSGDGANPHGTLILDGAGNIYGTTLNGGFYNAGTVFKLTPGGAGGWTESVINTFSGADGAGPLSGVIFDSKGNLYGATFSGGSIGAGVIFELTPSGGNWAEQVIYSFTLIANGANPSAGSLLMDSSGNLYGETYNGGFGLGVLFQLVPTGGGWTENVLHRFVNKIDGSYPSGGFVMDSAGDLWGTDTHGGIGGSGIVFEARVN